MLGLHIIVIACMSFYLKILTESIKYIKYLKCIFILTINDIMIKNMPLYLRIRTANYIMFVIKKSSD